MTDKITRTSFLLYKDSLSILDQLTDDQAGKLFRAIYHYQIKGNIGNVDQLIKIALNPFLSQFSRDNESYLNSILQGKLGNLKKYHKEIYQRVIAKELTIEEGEDIAYPAKKLLCRPPITPDQVGSLSDSVSDSVSVSDNTLTTFEYINMPNSKTLENNNISFISFSLSEFCTHAQIKKITVEQLKQIFRENHLLKGDAEDMHNHYAARNWEVPHGGGTKKIENIDNLIAVAKKWDKNHFKQYNNYQAMSGPNSSKSSCKGSQTALVLDNFEKEYLLTKNK